jgi:hypothetical protein
MSQSYHAQRIYNSPRESDVRVTSARCLYSVWFNDGECTVVGPGVQETTPMDSFPKFENDEDAAIYAVLLFENGLWPED